MARMEPTTAPTPKAPAHEPLDVGLLAFYAEHTGYVLVPTSHLRSLVAAARELRAQSNKDSQAHKRIAELEDRLDNADNLTREIDGLRAKIRTLIEENERLRTYALVESSCNAGELTGRLLDLDYYTGTIRDRWWDDDTGVGSLIIDLQGTPLPARGARAKVSW